jgi:hypothetical protein
VDTDASSRTRIAVLIDCDNVSSKHAEAVLEELAKYGTPTVKRAYGDWTTQHLVGWKPELHRHAIQPVQQFAYTVGKNSSDSALIIDAMDLLWQGNVEAFALVSSDSDFTRLATRLRESGKRVFGLGRRKTPESLRRAVDQFIFLEVLQEQEQDQDQQLDDAGDGGDRREPDAPGDEDRESRTPSINLQSALTKGVNATSDDDGWSRLSVVGQHLNRAHADFDPREFGYAKLSQLVQDQPYLETTTEGSHLMVRLRQKRSGRTTRTTDRTAAAKDAEKSPAKGTAAKGPAKTAAKTTAKATAKTPAQATSRSRSRAGTSASKESPANESPAQETPAKESAAQDAPAQESSVEEPAAQETPTRRTATRRTAGRRATSATTSPAGGDA